MPTGWENFGSVLGGGIDRAGAYDEGRLHTAKTEGALEQARQRQLQNVALEAKNRAQQRVRDDIAKAGIVPQEQQDLLGSVMLGEMGADFNAGMGGMAKGQEIDFRSTLGDPAAAPEAQFAAGQAVQGKALSPYETVGAGGYTDLRAGAPSIENTPLGDSMIMENEATAALTSDKQANPQRYRADASDPTSTLPTGAKVQAGYYANPDYDPTDPESPMVLPITGGDKDPNAPQKLGVNALAQFARVLNAAGNTALDLGNIMEMPSGASTGWFGQPGTTLLGATPGVLANKVTAAEVQQYKAIVGTLGEQLSTIERMGVRGSQGLTQKFDDLALREGDDVFTKMLKLAQMRQTVENGMDTLLSLNALSPDMAARATQLRNDISGAVPFTPKEVLALQQSKKPGMTMGDMLTQQRLTKPPAAPGRAPTTRPAAVPEIPLKNDKGWELMEDGDGNKAYVSPSGEIEEVVQ
jgi:hypothetical protein